MENDWVSVWEFKVGFKRMSHVFLVIFFFTPNMEQHKIVRNVSNKPNLNCLSMFYIFCCFSVTMTTYHTDDENSGSKITLEYFHQYTCHINSLICLATCIAKISLWKPQHIFVNEVFIKLQYSKTSPRCLPCSEIPGHIIEVV